MNFQKLILLLSEFWGERGCLIEQPWDLEVGAGTMHPATFLRVLGPEPWKVGYVQPSRRPADGRYGDNPFRLGKHYQFQVILKPSPADIQDLYLESLRRLGIRPEEHDIRFEEDNWESPTLGAWGVGWQVMCDGMEITQFTYFQQAGGIDLAPMAGEITYGLERLAMFLGARNSVYEVPWGPDYSYGDVRQAEEREWSKYYFETADVAGTLKMMEFAEGEANRCLAAGLVFPAYDWTLRCSHAFNTLDARGAVSATERVAMIKRVRVLAVACAQAYVKSREEAGWPMLDRSEWGRAKKAELLAAREAAAAAGGAK